MNNLFDETKFILKKYGISANKSLGQNFLIKESVVKTIIEKSEITKEDLVIEIGPGLGTLTKELLEHAGKVIAIELDRRMIEILTDRFGLYNNFELINDDVLKVDLNSVISSNLESSTLYSFFASIDATILCEPKRIADSVTRYGFLTSDELMITFS